METRQFVLTKEQNQFLKKLSFEKGVSVSTLIRVALMDIYKMPETDFTQLPDDLGELMKLSKNFEIESPD